MDSTGDLRSKEKLKKHIRDEITKSFVQVLDYAEVAIDGKERFKNFRARVLRASNDAIRELQKEIDSRYSVDYDPPSEDVIVTRARSRR